MKTRWLILGILSDAPFQLNLLVRCTEDMLDSHDGNVLAEKGSELFSGGFNGSLPTAETDGQEPVEFASCEEALAFIESEKAAGSNWTYALWTIHEPNN
ncbi:MAG: hypothetical protein V4662_17805 [Verrucomicrobiota bacterium]